MRRMMNLVGSVTLSLAISAISMGPVVAQTSAPAKSPAMAPDANRGMVEATLKGKKVSIDYGRPEMKGRDMLAMAPDGFVWRLGMNQSTTFKTDSDLMFGKLTLAKGSYSAWLKHVKGDQWALVFNSEVGVWGMPGAKRENDLLEVPITYAKTTTKAVERLTLELMNHDGSGHLVVTWGNHKLESMFSPK